MRYETFLKCRLEFMIIHLSIFNAKPTQKFYSARDWVCYSLISEVKKLQGRDGFGGLVVSIWHPSLRVQTRPKPLDFSGVKILSMPSSGGEVKESVQCPSFAACKRT